jgi:hypothetical protein
MLSLNYVTRSPDPQVPTSVSFAGILGNRIFLFHLSVSIISYYLFLNNNPLVLCLVPCPVLVFCVLLGS